MDSQNNRYEFTIAAVTGKPGELMPVPQRSKRKRAGMLIALALVCALLLGGAGGIGGYLLMNTLNVPAEQEQAQDVDGGSNNVLSDTDDAKTPDDGGDGGTGGSENKQSTQNPLTLAGTQNLNTLSIQDIFAAGDLSTVAISTTASTQNVFGQYSNTASAGSGFILTADGYIMTNYHVVDGYSEISVMLHDGTEYPAEMIGGDELTDIAVLKIDAQKLQPVSIGDSDEIRVGDMVAAIGNPLGELANSLSVGYVSAKERIVSIDDIPRAMLQTDAAVSPGNSGGPLFNLYGQVIGVVSAKSVGDGVEGIGFAIPINHAVEIANELMTHGYIKNRPYIGIECTSSSRYYNMPSGVYVYSVTAGSPADKAGFKQGDVILSFDGQEVSGAADLTAIKNTLNVGDTVEVVVYRSGEEITLSLTLGETPNPADEVESTESPSPSEEQEQSGQNTFRWPPFSGFGG